MLRRKFIQRSLAAGVGLSTLPVWGNPLLASTAETAPFFKLSLAQWSLHRSIWENKISPYDFAEKASTMGFEGLEYVNGLYADVMKANNKKQALEKFIARSNEKAAQHNVKNLLIMIDGEGDLVVPDKKERNTAIEQHKPWIETAAAMDCHSIRINLFGERNREEWKKRAAESMRALCEFAQGYNINILVENHGYLSSDAALVMAMLDDVQLPNCGTLPDFGNFCLAREQGERWDGECIRRYNAYQGVEEMLPKAFAVSAKSYAFDDSGKETTIDYARMIALVKASGYRGYIGVEYEGDDRSEEEGILATRNLLRKVAAPT